MAKKKKVVVATKKKENLKPTQSKKSDKNSSKSVAASLGEDMLFKRENYIWILSGAGLIVLGLLLMSGGSMPDGNTWDPDLIYSFRRITLAPIVILAGIACQFVAIFKK